jgi:D-glycero-alpha-D-manno-heptose 1-phosphate guanylyltransferase
LDTIDAIILAGGLGTRLRETVRDVPKSLAPVDGKPFLDIILKTLRSSGNIKKVVIAVGYMAEKIIKRYHKGENFGLEIEFSIEKELLGTGGGVKKALAYCDSTDVLVLNGDSYVDISIPDFLTFHKQHNSLLSMALKEVENANRYGRVNISKDSSILSFEEKLPRQESGFINAGMYLFNKELFNDVEEKKVLSLERDLLPNMIKKRSFGFVCHGKFIDIGTTESFGIASEYLKK